MIVYQNDNYMKIVDELLTQETKIKSLLLPRQSGKTYFFEQNYRENDIFVVKMPMQVKQTMMNLKMIYPKITPKVTTFDRLDNYVIGRNLNGVKLLIDDIPLSHVLNIANRLVYTKISCIWNLYTY